MGMDGVNKYFQWGLAKGKEEASRKPAWWDCYQYGSEDRSGEISNDYTLGFSQSIFEERLGADKKSLKADEAGKIKDLLLYKDDTASQLYSDDDWQKLFEALDINQDDEVDQKEYAAFLKMQDNAGWWTFGQRDGKISSSNQSEAVSGLIGYDPMRQGSYNRKNSIKKLDDIYNASFADKSTDNTQKNDGNGTSDNPVDTNNQQTNNTNNDNTQQNVNKKPDQDNNGNYKVMSNDNLWKIAQQNYPELKDNRKEMWKIVSEIITLNNLSNLYGAYQGQQLILPSKSAVSQLQDSRFMNYDLDPKEVGLSTN